MVVVSFIVSGKGRSTVVVNPTPSNEGVMTAEWLLAGSAKRFSLVVRVYNALPGTEFVEVSTTLSLSDAPHDSEFVTEYGSPSGNSIGAVSKEGRTLDCLSVIVPAVVQNFCAGTGGGSSR